MYTPILFLIPFTCKLETISYPLLFVYLFLCNILFVIFFHTEELCVPRLVMDLNLELSTGSRFFWSLKRVNSMDFMSKASYTFLYSSSAFPVVDTFKR